MLGIRNNFCSSRISNYPIADVEKVRKEVEAFNKRNTAFLDPKNNSSFLPFFLKLSRNIEKLAELNERYISYRKEIKFSLNSDIYQTQYDAFKVWGTTQMSPMEWNFSNEDASIQIEISNIYNACNSTMLIIDLNLHPAFTAQHQKINADLATEYYEKMISCTKENEHKYYNALCTYHSVLASKLGRKP
jgi:hypothetical protein